MTQCCPMGTCGGYPRPVCSCPEDCECMCLGCDCTGWSEEPE